MNNLPGNLPNINQHQMALEATFARMEASLVSIANSMTIVADSTTKQLRLSNDIIVQLKKQETVQQQFMETVLQTLNKTHPKTKKVHAAMVEEIRDNVIGQLLPLPGDKEEYFKQKILSFVGPAKVDEADPAFENLVEQINLDGSRYFTDMKSRVKKGIVEDVLLVSCQANGIEEEERREIQYSSVDDIVAKFPVFLTNVFDRCKEFQLTAKAGVPTVPKLTFLASIIQTTFKQDIFLAETSNGANKGKLPKKGDQRAPKRRKLTKTNSKNEEELAPIVGDVIQVQSLWDRNNERNISHLNNPV